MKNISDEVVSVEEARAALRCMRLCSFDEGEALESVESLIHRIRRVGTAKLVEEVIENRLSDTQRKFIKEYWYENKNTAQIARDNGVSQANVYRTIARANEAIKNFIMPLVMYHSDLTDIKVQPLYFEEIMKISSAMKQKDGDVSDQLRNLRLSNGVKPEQLAKAVCITTKELELIENGRKMPTVDLIARYSKVFGIEIDLKFEKGKGRYEWKEA